MEQLTDERNPRLRRHHVKNRTDLEIFTLSSILYHKVWNFKVLQIASSGNNLCIFQWSMDLTAVLFCLSQHCVGQGSIISLYQSTALQINSVPAWHSAIWSSKNITFWIPALWNFTVKRLTTCNCISRSNKLMKANSSNYWQVLFLFFFLSVGLFFVCFLAWFCLFFYHLCRGNTLVRQKKAIEISGISESWEFQQ